MKNAKEALTKMGFEIVGESKRTENGPDLWVRKGRRVFSVEVKRAKVFKRGATGVPAVEKNRRGDDLIAVEYPSGHVLIEPMRAHLKNCGPAGTRGTYPLS